MQSRSGEPGVFGSEAKTQILLAIYLLGETYLSELASLLGRSVSRIQDAVASFEAVGMVSVSNFGRARRVEMNPRFYAAEEINALLQKLAVRDVELQKKLATKRRRPRKTGKEI